MTWLLYGANGYTGELCSRKAVDRGMAPTLAGRSRSAVEGLANELGVGSKAFGLDDPKALRAALEGVEAVLHCAGPFVRTSQPMIEACLETGTHYLDITGEIPVFEAAFRCGSQARSAGVTLLPGVGFDVVPTDCLAARLAEAVPNATELELAFHSDGGSISRGTLKTMIESLPHAAAVREDGRIRGIPAASDAKKIDFACGTRWAMAIGWGDVSTAYRSTGIPNIKVYNGTPPRAIRRMSRMRPLLPLAALKPIKRAMQWWVGRTVVGPDADVRATARMHLWGSARGPEAAATATFDTPEGYAFTADASIEAMRRVLEGPIEPGTTTPSLAFGSGFAESLPGVGDLRISPETP